MLRSYVFVAGLAATALALGSACGGVTNEGTGGAAGGPAAEHALPPEAPPDKATDGTTDTILAIRKLYLGDTNRDGTPNKVNGWKQYGYDLDGQISTASSTDLCKPRNNAAPKNVYPDGEDGIDNSFGKNILSIILGLQSDASVKINESITQKGSFTLMLALQKLGKGEEYNPIRTLLYGGADLGKAPAFDGSDKWPVLPELLEDPKDITTAQVHFDKSYLVGNTWVSGSKGNINLTLSISGFSLTLTIASALISMELSADHKKAEKGTIAGVLETDVLTAELKKIAGRFDKTLCKGPTIDSIVSQIESASDILKNGTQKAGQPCDGISIGLGFDAAVVQLGDIAMPAMGGTDPCATPP